MSLPERQRLRAAVASLLDDQVDENRSTEAAAARLSAATLLGDLAVGEATSSGRTPRF
jgi:hypothetical protein